MTNVQRVGCSSNLRQVGQAVLLYAGDHDGILPGNSGAGSVGPQFIDGVAVTGNAYPYVAKALAAYIPDSVWACTDPEMRRRLPTMQGAVWFKPAQPFYNQTFLNPLSGEG